MQKYNHKEKKAILAYILAGLILILVLIFSFSLFARYEKDTTTNELNNISILSENGIVKFNIKIADTDEKRQIGLMNVKSMNENEGMLFYFPEQKLVSFWMKDTYIPLDMIFIDKNKRIVKIHKNTTPLNEEILYSGEAMYVLEINGGLADKFGISEGNRVEF